MMPQNTVSGQENDLQQNQSGNWQQEEGFKVDCDSLSFQLPAIAFS